MVLDDRGHDHVVAPEVEAVGEVVDGLGGVAADDRDVVGAISPGVRGEGRPGVLVGTR